MKAIKQEDKSQNNNNIAAKGFMLDKALYSLYGYMGNLVANYYQVND